MATDEMDDEELMLAEELALSTPDLTAKRDFGSGCPPSVVS